MKDIRKRTASRLTVGVESLNPLRDITRRHAGFFRVTALDFGGNLLWFEDWGRNLVTNEGEAHFLDVGIHAASQVSTCFDLDWEICSAHVFCR